MKKNIKYKTNSGAAMMIVVLFFMFISLTILVGIITPVVREFKIASNNFGSKQSYFIAESGAEDMVYRVKNNMDIGIIGTDRTLYLNNSFVSIPTTFTDLGGGKKQISTTGNVNSNERTVGLTLTTTTGVSFNYGVQVGQGGIDMNGSSGIRGNVYANGPITGSTSSFITGTAISANSPSLTSDQSNGTGIPTNNVNFGNINTTQDVAQSFKVSSLVPLSKVTLYIKKTGSPSDATIKIMNDSSGNVGTMILASGTLLASSVSTSYGWVEISFTTNPILDTSKTYWLIVDASTSSSKYYTIGATTGNNYTNGKSKIGQLGGTWNNTNSNIIDYYFGLYLGGFTGLIKGTSLSQWNQLSIGTSGSGTAQAHTVDYTEAPGLIYCQTGTGNNKSCTPQPDPAYIANPVSDSNINGWKNEAIIGGTYTGTYNTPSSGSVTLGPKKITGDLNITGSSTLFVTGTLWVQGNVTVSGSAKIVLALSYGNSSGIIVSDGWLDLSGSGQLNGSGQSGSYILFVTTSNCDASFCAHNAIDITGSAGSVVLNAQNGTIKFTGSASAKEATAYKIKLEGSTVVTYESGLANMNFSSGPSGSWGIDGWKETE